MPFNELKHQSSFPPTIVHLSPPINTDKPLPSPPSLDPLEIEAERDPISFFLTTPTPDEEDYDTDDYFDYDEDYEYAAGIEGSEEDLRSKEVREVSPSSLQREKEDSCALVDEVEDVDNRPLLSRDDDLNDEVVFGFAMPLSLKDFTARSTTVSTPTAPRDIPSDGRRSRTSQYAPHLRGLGIDMDMHIPEFHPRTSSLNSKDRGRGRVKLSPIPIPSGSGSPRRTASLSPRPRKPVSWRVPSRGIWRIDEVEEERVSGGLSSSAPALGGAGILRNGNGNVAAVAEKKAKEASPMG